MTNFRHRHEIRAIMALTLPILTTQLAQIGMATIDTLLAGRVATVDLAAVAIGSALWLPVWLFLAGILVALTPLVARYRWANNDEITPNSLYLAAQLLALIASVITGLLLALAAQLLPRFIDDIELTTIARQYLLMIAISMPAVGLFLAARFYAEAMNAADRVAKIMLLGLLLNVPFSAVFVFGWLGLPELGGVGCGVGSALVMVFLAVAMRHDVDRRFVKVDSNPSDFVRSIQWNLVQRLLALGLPIGIAVFFEVSLFTVIALLITDLGTATVAGHQIALNVSSLTFMLPLSLAMALTVRVSGHIGRHQASMARTTAKVGLILNLLLAIFNASILMFACQWLAGLYSDDDLVIQIASQLLFLAALFQFSDAVQIAAAGALRGYEDTKTVMMITFVCYWCIGLGSGYWLAFGDLGLGAAGFWYGLIIGLSAAAVGLGWRLLWISRQSVFITSDAMPATSQPTTESQPDKIHPAN